MRLLRSFRRLAWLGLACVFVGPLLAAEPEERDRQVLEALLSHLLTDPKFDLTRAPTNDATILLHLRTPDKTGFLMPQQIRAEIDNRALPGDAEDDLRKRNAPPGARPDTYDAVVAYYTNLTFAAGIVVTNVSEMTQDRRRMVSFTEANPKARGFLTAYLPGYSSDGNRAVVRATVGPWAHAAMLTAVLEKRGDKWSVVWYHVARFV